MRSSLDYAGFAQLCGKSPIMREIMRAHNRIIPRSLVDADVAELAHYRPETGVNLTAAFHSTRMKRFESRVVDRLRFGVDLCL